MPQSWRRRVFLLTRPVYPVMLAERRLPVRNFDVKLTLTWMYFYFYNNLNKSQKYFNSR
jgi:hypothetical protein